MNYPLDIPRGYFWVQEMTDSTSPALWGFFNCDTGVPWSCAVPRVGMDTESLRMMMYLAQQAGYAVIGAEPAYDPFLTIKNKLSSIRNQTPFAGENWEFYASIALARVAPRSAIKPLFCSSQGGIHQALMAEVTADSEPHRPSLQDYSLGMRPLTSDAWRDIYLLIAILNDLYPRFVTPAVSAQEWNRNQWFPQAMSGVLVAPVIVANAQTKMHSDNVTQEIMADAVYIGAYRGLNATFLETYMSADYTVSMLQGTVVDDAAVCNAFAIDSALDVQEVKTGLSDHNANLNASVTRLQQDISAVITSLSNSMSVYNGSIQSHLGAQDTQQQSDREAVLAAMSTYNGSIQSHLGAQDTQQQSDREAILAAIATSGGGSSEQFDAFVSESRVNFEVVGSLLLRLVAGRIKSKEREAFIKMLYDIAYAPQPAPSDLNDEGGLLSLYGSMFDDKGSPIKPDQH